MGRARISVQVQLLSGHSAYKKVFVRVSTDGKELVLTLPMSPYMSRTDLAFDSFVLAETQVPETELKYLKVLLKHHPKCAARMVAVSKVKGRSFTDGFFYEQRIRLPRKVQHTVASTTDGDELFFGKKFIQYPDGSVHLHVELIGEVKDNYIPEERMLDPKMIKSPPKSVPESMDADSSAARVLPTTGMTSMDTSEPAIKRKRDDGTAFVETVTEEEDDDDDGEDDGNMSTVTGPQAGLDAAMAARQAEEEAFAEAARNKAAAVLSQVDQQEKTSLQSAVEQGRAAAATEDPEL